MSYFSQIVSCYIQMTITMEEDAVSARFNHWVYSGKGQRVPKNVISVRFHFSITTVDERAFNSCTYLREIVFNEGLKKIRESAFQDCRLLERIILPSTLTEIGERAFDNCTNLREVELHEGLPTIGSSSFVNCLLLETFKFPSLSTRLETIVHCRAQVETKIDEVRGPLERNGVELFITAAAIGVSSRNWRVASNWDTLRAILGQIVSWIRYYEIKETTPLFELALWKANMNQSGAANIARREAYRIEVPGPVKDAILQYL